MLLGTLQKFKDDSSQKTEKVISLILLQIRSMIKLHKLGELISEFSKTH